MSSAHQASCSRAVLNDQSLLSIVQKRLSRPLALQTRSSTTWRGVPDRVSLHEWVGYRIVLGNRRGGSIHAQVTVQNTF